MTYKLILTKRAKQDRDEAFAWYSANYSEEFAGRWYEGLAAAIESLRMNPARCHKAAESERLSIELHELLFGKRRTKHRVLFLISGQSVIVMQIRHAAMRDLTADDL